MTRSSLLPGALVLTASLMGSSASAQVTTPRGPYARAFAQGATIGFSVVLVLGDLQGGPAPASEAVPAAAAKALADLKDFLPYKSYRLLDAQWTTGTDRVTSSLRGADGKEYELTLQARSGPEAVAISRFLLREAGAAAPALTSLHPMARKAQSAVVFGGKIPGAVIDTSFNMDIGETVVVGTSRLQGDKALIVLLTAVGRPQARQTTSPGPPTTR